MLHFPRLIGDIPRKVLLISLCLSIVVIAHSFATSSVASFADLQNSEGLGEKSKSKHCISVEGSDFAKTVFQQQIIAHHSTHK
jgi:hypothetical protein